MRTTQIDSVADVFEGLKAHDYLPDEGLATAIFLSMELQRPLLLEGEAGVGKTEVAKTLAKWTGGRLIRLQGYEGLDASQAVYEWDYSRQLLHLRTAEVSGGVADRASLEDELYTERFLVKRPLLQAISHDDEVPPILLIDEVDRTDDEFEAFVIITSNRTRDVHDALKRRALYHWVEHPGFAREVEIIGRRTTDVPSKLAKLVAAAVEQFRQMGLYKPPGVAESIDWAQALARLGSQDLDPAVHGAEVSRGSATHSGLRHSGRHRRRQVSCQLTRPTSRRSTLKSTTISIPKSGPRSERSRLVS